MARNSGIEWTDHTINFWWGCHKVSAGCANCYAETLSNRFGKSIWGPPKSTVRERKKSPWGDILKLDREAGDMGIRYKVFVQSMSDFFEDHPMVTPWREEAMCILEDLKHIDVQLLTKRIELVPDMASSWMSDWPPHIWMGTSVEDQDTAESRIIKLMEIPSRIRWISLEPMLGPVSLASLFVCDYKRGSRYLNALSGMYYTLVNPYLGICSFDEDEYYSRPEFLRRGIDWVVLGFESGKNARKGNPSWVRDVRMACSYYDVSFFFKQWGEYAPKRVGGNRDFMIHVGKKKAGNMLDGKEYKEFPV